MNMKRNLIYFLPLLMLLAAGCFGNKNQAPAPSVPIGTFKGQFFGIHTSIKNNLDTLKANLQLVLSPGAAFAVTGDTSTVHAGSYGNFGITSNSTNYINFVDKTFPISGNASKIHLSGTYQYYYDGTTFQMVGTSVMDTLILEYKMTRVN